MSESYLLRGIDGSNPLGFLAAVGAARLLEGARLGWGVEGCVWRPTLWVPDLATEEALCARLAELTRVAPAAVKMLGKNLTVAPEVFGAYMEKVERLGRQGEPAAGGYAAAFGSEVCVDAKRNRIESTKLSFITGSGHQDFVTTVVRLSEAVDAGHIREALFGLWERKDKSLSFRWDPQDAAEYALCAGDPSKEGAWTVWGANRLAFEALPLFPVQPTRRGLRTTGFREEKYPEEFSWPMWEAAVGVDTMRALFAYGELQAASPNRAALGAMGIGEVFRAPRVRIGPGANFKVSFRPARGV